MSRVFRGRAAHGFTLIELMVVITIAGIMATIGLPSFRTFIEGQRIKTASSDFAMAAVYARSEAIKRNAEVKIIAASGGWTNGWNVTVTSGSLVIGTQAPYSGITFATSPTATEVAYQGSGRLGSAATTLTVSGSAGTTKRCVGFDLSGLPKSKQGTNCP